MGCYYYYYHHYTCDLKEKKKQLLIPLQICACGNKLNSFNGLKKKKKTNKVQNPLIGNRFKSTRI